MYVNNYCVFTFRDKVVDKQLIQGNLSRNYYGIIDIYEVKLPFYICCKL